MSASHTYHTLNDYRVSTETIYENGSRAKLGAGALVAAIFLSVGAYFFYPMYHRSPARSPVPAATNYQAPTTGAPVDAMPGTAPPDTPSETASSPTTLPYAPAPALDRKASESKPNVSPEQPVQRAKQSVKQNTKSTSEAATPSPGNTTTLIPDMIKPAPITSPQPTAADHATDTAAESTATHSGVLIEAPIDGAPGTSTRDSAGG